MEEIPIKSPEEETSFEIALSSRSGDLIAGMPPDIATCPDCRSELFDPSDRRHRYPFINCTNCGPRFSIIRALPYDRSRTSMASFTLCPPCRTEYENPADRRFDAQPNACPACGPVIKLLTSDGKSVTDTPFETAAELLRNGQILAVKGIGGYHLCCDATSNAAVALLRKRKNRPHKSLAVMFANMEELRHHAEVSAAETEELAGCAAPIVVVRLKPRQNSYDAHEAIPGAHLSQLVSPDTDDIGAFLPYSPVHHLLLSEISPLVMTSGNMAEEPIAKNEDDLKRILGKIADAALIHNREIVRRCDDSVLKIAEGKRLVLRRSRGIVPDHIPLAFEGPSVLACGAEMKNTICITRGDRAFISPHIGDIGDYRSYAFFREMISDFSDLLRVRPEIVAHDAHPDYPSTRYALGLVSARRVAVQHHHAHIASCMAEHGLAGPVIGVALDGTGYGPDGTVWGGEFLVADFKNWRRAAHFRQYPMPGGDLAVLNPIRMALSCLLSDLPPKNQPLIRELLPHLTQEEWNVLPRMIETGFRSPPTSSAGRLFDAAAAMLGIAEPITYEGQAAVRLQTLARRDETSTYPFNIQQDRQPATVSCSETIRAMVSDIRNGVDRRAIAGRFHNTIAEAIARTCSMIRERERLNDVALSGGVFQNEFLLKLSIKFLMRDGFSVYCHHLVPPNDGGISLGQAAVATAMSGKGFGNGRHAS